MRTTLVAALSECVDHRKRKTARRFLQGLSADELQYIAEFLGSCILEAPSQTDCSRRQLAEGITQFENCRHSGAICRKQAPQQFYDQDHKMILLLEYLCRSGLTQYSLVVKAGQA